MQGNQYRGLGGFVLTNEESAFEKTARSAEGAGDYELAFQAWHKLASETRRAVFYCQYGDIVFDDLMVDATGNVYGTTGPGPGVPYGKVYKLSEQGSKWIETVLYLFQGAPDGDRPAAKLLRDN